MATSGGYGEAMEKAAKRPIDARIVSMLIV